MKLLIESFSRLREKVPKADEGAFGVIHPNAKPEALTSFAAEKHFARCASHFSLNGKEK